MIELYVETLPILQRAFVQLESKIEKPVFVKRGTYHVFRYKKQSIEAAAIQKLARIISGLNASLLLLKHGFVQELCVIFRTLGEFNEDIIFLCKAMQSVVITELHQKYLNSFYKEEFNVPDNPFLSEQNRLTIRRKKIHAAVAKMSENELNSSDAIELKRTVSQAYSGYIHGASVHIMDMCGGNPPEFYLSGMLNTPRISESIKDTWNYFYGGLISVMMVATSFNEQKLLADLYSFRTYFEKQSGRTEWEHPESMIKKLKNNRDGSI